MPQSGQLISTSFRICRYDLRFQLRWCRKAQSTAQYSAIPLSVNSHDDLAITLDAGGSFVVGADGKISRTQKGFSGQFGLTGETRNDITHEIFSAQGEHLTVAREESFVERGPLNYCRGFMVVCIDPPQ